MNYLKKTIKIVIFSIMLCGKDIQAMLPFKPMPRLLTHKPNQDSLVIQTVIAEQKERHQFKVDSAEGYEVGGKKIFPKVFTLTCEYIFKTGKRITVTSHSEPTHGIKAVHIINKTKGKRTIIPARRTDILVMLITKHKQVSAQTAANDYETISSIHTRDGILHIKAYQEDAETNCIVEHPEQMNFEINAE